MVMFNCGLNKILWVWGIKFLKQFLDDEKYDNLSKLLKIYTVHDSWFVKSITQIFNTKKNIQSLQRMIDNFSLSNGLDSMISNSSNTTSKIVRCADLSELSRYVDITKLKISLNIYKHNLLENDGIGLNLTNFVPTLSHESFHHHFYQIFNILNNYADKVELIFHKPGNKLNTDILFQCINRDQRIWINDWDLWCIGATFKKILTDLPEPIISINSIELPIQDNLKYTRSSFKHILRSSSQQQDYSHLILFQFIELCYKILNNSEITKHSPASLAKSVSHCLSHEMILLNKDRISIVNRFLKNVFDHWAEIRTELVGTYPSVDAVVRKRAEGVSTAQSFNSYDISYDLTIDNDEEDLEYRVAFNTTNILSDDKNLKRIDAENRPESSQLKPEQLKTPVKPAIKKRSLFSPARVTPPNFGVNSHSKSNSNGGNIPNINTAEHPTNKTSRTISPGSTHTTSKSIGSSLDIASTLGSTTPKNGHTVSRSISSIGSVSTIVPSPAGSPSSSTVSLNHKLKKEPTLKDVSNITVQYPPQKYKFQKPQPSVQTTYQLAKQFENVKMTQSPVKKPVIRGRKVGELAKLFEERAEALEVLSTM